MSGRCVFTRKNALKQTELLRPGVLFMFTHHMLKNLKLGQRDRRIQLKRKNPRTNQQATRCFVFKKIQICTFLRLFYNISVKSLGVCTLVHLIEIIFEHAVGNILTVFLIEIIIYYFLPRQMFSYAKIAMPLKNLTEPEWCFISF